MGEYEFALNEFWNEVYTKITQKVCENLKGDNEDKQIVFNRRIVILDEPTAYHYIDGIEQTKEGKLIATYSVEDTNDFDNINIQEKTIAVRLLSITTLTRILDMLNDNEFCFCQIE